MKRTTFTNVEKIHRLTARYLPKHHHRLVSARLLKFDLKRHFKTKKRCMLRNDWTTYRAIEVEWFLYNKFNLSSNFDELLPGLFSRHALKHA